jgi:hypothetical protein
MGAGNVSAGGGVLACIKVPVIVLPWLFLTLTNRGLVTFRSDESQTGGVRVGMKGVRWRQNEQARKSK